MKLDFECVIYHKGNNEITELDGLGLSNGATLELVIETIDEYIKQLKVVDWALPCLREHFGETPINTLSAFGSAVDTRLCELQEAIDNIVAEVPLVANDSATINFSVSGTLDHTLTGVVKISADADNTLSAHADGLYAAPQSLSVDYDEKTLSISNGNTVSLLNLCGCDGPESFLGNFTVDPIEATNGQTWFRTDLPVANGLRVLLNGSVRTIPTT